MGSDNWVKLWYQVNQSDRHDPKKKRKKT